MPAAMRATRTTILNTHFLDVLSAVLGGDDAFRAFLMSWVKSSPPANSLPFPCAAPWPRCLQGSQAVILSGCQEILRMITEQEYIGEINVEARK